MQLNHKILGEGNALVILHGLLGMLDNWQAPARKLEHRFRCILVDARNHGRSPHAVDHTYDLMVEDTIELMDQLKIDKAHVLGHSMGGKTAMRLAQRFPDRVEQLVVVDIGPKFYPIHHEQIFAALNAVPLDKIERRTEAEEFMMPHIQDGGVRQFLMKSLYHESRGKFGWRFNLKGLEENLSNVGEAMDEVDYEGETLFIRGEKSDYILDEDWPDIKMLFPNAFLQTIENAGHWVHAEQQDAFVDSVNEFLND